MNKKQQRRYYAAQRREQKQIYKEENGSAKGWQSSEAFTRIARNQRKTERRYEKKVVVVERDREIKRKKGKVGQQKLDNITPWSMYHSVLGYGDGPRNEIRSFFAVLRSRSDKQTYLRIEYPNGKVIICRTLLEADNALRDLYKFGKTLQGPTGNDNYGMLVSAVKGETETERFVNVYTMDISGKEGDFDLDELPEDEI